MPRTSAISRISGFFRDRPTPRSLEEQVYAALLREGDTAFDIGANAGRVTTFIARVIGSGGCVVAFEPVWSVYRELCRNVRDLDSRAAPVAPVPFGFADVAGIRELHVPEGISELASLADERKWEAAHRITWSESHKAMFRRLDEFLQTTNVPMPVFIKLDVEGAENMVLDGAGTVLAGERRPLMLIELFAPWQKVMGFHPYDLLSRLAANEYEFLFVCPKGLMTHLPTREDPFPGEFRDGYNIVAFVRALHDERIASLRPLMKGGGGRILPMHPPPQPNVVT